MCVCVCVCVCMCVRVYVCACAYVFYCSCLWRWRLGTLIHLPAYVHICDLIRTHTHEFTHARTYIRLPFPLFAPTSKSAVSQAAFSNSIDWINFTPPFSILGTRAGGERRTSIQNGGLRCQCGRCEDGTTRDRNRNSCDVCMGEKVVLFAKPSCTSTLNHKLHTLSLKP